MTSTDWTWLKAKDTIDEIWIRKNGQRYLQKEAKASCCFCGKIKTDLVGTSNNIYQVVCKNCLKKLILLEKEMKLGISKLRYLEYNYPTKELEMRIPTKKEIQEREEFEGERYGELK